MSGHLYRYDNGEYWGLASDQAEADWGNRKAPFILTYSRYCGDKDVKVVWHPAKMLRIEQNSSKKS